MSKSRFGGFRIGRRVFSDWETLKSPSAGNASVPSTIQDFDYTKAQGIWNLDSTVQFPRREQSPIEFIGSSKITASSTSTNHTINLPSGVQNGDLLILIVSQNFTYSTTPPTGWTEVLDIQDFSVSYKIASGEGSSVTFSGTSGTVRPSAIIACFRGAVFDAIGSSVVGQSSTPGVNVSAGGLAIWCAGNYRDTSPTPASLGPSEWILIEDASNGSMDAPSAMFYKEFPEGNTGSISHGSNAATASVLVSIKPG